jgi:hypothetical protein
MDTDKRVDKSFIWIGRAILNAIKFTWYVVVMFLLYFLALISAAWILGHVLPIGKMRTAYLVIHNQKNKMKPILFIFLFFLVSCTKVMEKPITCYTNGVRFDNSIRNTDYITPIWTTGHGNAVILLDFDGETVSNTNWRDGTYPSSGMTISEMKSIFDSVAYDFRQFNTRLTLTTDEEVYNSAPINKRVRIIFTERTNTNSIEDGEAVLGSFTSGDNTPCFVYTAELGHNTKLIREIASHELGHTFNLRHDKKYKPNTCIKEGEYNDNLVIGMIMGDSRCSIRGQWSVDLCIEQDDTLIIANVLKQV